MSEFLSLGDPGATVHVILAHGAGAPMTSPFMEGISHRLADEGLRVTRFEFSYMAARRIDGRRRPSPRSELLVGEWLAAHAAVTANTGHGQYLFIGGKSLGGRIASLVADQLHAARRINGLICLGYTFHPPKMPDRLRTAHLEGLTTPSLIVQGERDPFGTRPEVEALTLSPAIRFEWIPAGDHDLAPRADRARTRDGNLALASRAIVAFTRGQSTQAPLSSPRTGS